MKSTVSATKFMRDTLRRANKEPRCIWARAVTEKPRLEELREKTTVFSNAMFNITSDMPTQHNLGVDDKKLSCANAREIVDELKFPQSKATIASPN